MGSGRGLNYTCLTASHAITNEPTLLWGAVILTKTTGGDATIYDGRDTTSGRKVIRLEGIADQSTPLMFPKPVMLALGLYVAVGTNVSEVLVVWERGPLAARFERGVEEAVGTA